MRALLLKAEALPIEEDDEFQTGFVDMEADLRGEDRYQIYLMKDAGWIEGRDAEQGYFRITSSGHDYLDATRDVSVWERTKLTVAETGGSATLEIVKSLAVGFLKKKISDQTGIEL